MQSPTGDCFQSLASYEALYAALDPEYQPASFRFWDSDYAFARERITSSPAFITRVNSLSEVPFTQAQVLGYDAITGGVSMQELVAQQRLFIVDFMPLYQQGVLVAAPDAFLEVPTAVFFLTGPPEKPAKRQGFTTSKHPNKSGSQLMPLAIKVGLRLGADVKRLIDNSNNEAQCPSTLTISPTVQHLQPKRVLAQGHARRLVPGQGACIFGHIQHQWATKSLSKLLSHRLE